MDKGTRNVIVAALALGAAAVSVYFAAAGHPQRIDLDPYNVLGAVTAEETAKLLTDPGAVLVIARDTGADLNPSVEAELAAFQRTLKQHPRVSAVTERIRVTPMLMMATGGGVPPEALFQALERHANVQALVLFFGLPQLADAELETLKKAKVKTVVVSSLRSGYKQLLERQAITVAIVPRADAPPASAQPPRTVRERFDQEFTILTPADAARLP